MKVLVIGGGGREHALVWKLAQSDRISELFCAPGNAGIAELARCVPIAATEVDRLAAFASENRVDLTVVGPEAPLCAGIADCFRARGLRIFGPSRAAARLEGSKVFAKQFFQRHRLPTAEAQVFDNAEQARAFVRKRGAPIVVKADGLAAGKGVVVAQSVEEAGKAIGEIMEQKIFGPAGARVLIEECLQGEEASVMAFVDGKSVKLLAAAQDHKRLFDGDRGPNTGGMGAYSPAPVVTESVSRQVEEILQRTLAGLNAERLDYRGVLYAGLMLTADGPKLLEFNCRFGDPETQAVAARMDFDLAEAAEAVAEARLESVDLRWKPEAAVCVVMAAGGYPGPYERGRPIEGLKQAADLDRVCVFHAGTKRGADGQILTDGGRVLGVTALGRSIEEASRRAYEAVGRIRFDGAHYRRDIAARALAAQSNAAKR